MRKVKSEDFFGLTESELLQDDDRGCTNEENQISEFIYTNCIFIRKLDVTCCTKCF